MILTHLNWKVALTTGKVLWFGIPPVKYMTSSSGPKPKKIVCVLFKCKKKLNSISKSFNIFFFLALFNVFDSYIVILLTNFRHFLFFRAKSMFRCQRLNFLKL